MKTRCIIVGKERAGIAATNLSTSEVPTTAKSPDEALRLFGEEFRILETELKVVAVLVDDVPPDDVAELLEVIEGELIGVEMHLVAGAMSEADAAVWKAYTDNISLADQPVQVASVIKQRWFPQVDPTVRAIAHTSATEDDEEEEPATVGVRRAVMPSRPSPDREVEKSARPAVVAPVSEPKKMLAQKPVVEAKPTKATRPPITKKATTKNGTVRHRFRGLLGFEVIDLSSPAGLRRAAALFAK